MLTSGEKFQIFSKLNTILYHIGPFKRFLFNIFSIDLIPGMKVKKCWFRNCWKIKVRKETIKIKNDEDYERFKQWIKEH